MPVIHLKLQSDDLNYKNYLKVHEIEFDISNIFKIFFPDQNLNHVLHRYNKSVKLLEEFKTDTFCN